jgi:hypothetical protein
MLVIGGGAACAPGSSEPGWAASSRAATRPIMTASAWGGARLRSELSMSGPPVAGAFPQRAERVIWGWKIDVSGVDLLRTTGRPPLISLRYSRRSGRRAKHAPSCLLALRWWWVGAHESSSEHLGTAGHRGEAAGTREQRGKVADLYPLLAHRRAGVEVPTLVETGLSRPLVQAPVRGQEAGEIKNIYLVGAVDR